jgi:hypothetical protein
MKENLSMTGTDPARVRRLGLIVAGAARRDGR